jgi:hypothetical protein
MKGLGAAIIQEGKVVTYASRALTPTEQRYAQIEKEALAVVFFKISSVIVWKERCCHRIRSQAFGKHYAQTYSQSPNAYTENASKASTL